MTGLPVFDMHRAGGWLGMYKFQLTRLTETHIPITHAGPPDYVQITPFEKWPYHHVFDFFHVGFKGYMIMAVLSLPPDSIEKWP